MKRFDDKNGTDDKKKRKRILFMAGLIAVIIITAALFYFNSFVMETENSRARDSLLEWTEQNAALVGSRIDMYYDFHYMDLWRDCQTERHYAHMKSGARKRTPLWCYLFIIFSFLLVEDSACNGKGCDYKNCCISTDRGVITGLDSDYPLAVTFVYLSCCSTGSCCGCIA